MSGCTQAYDKMHDVCSSTTGYWCPTESSHLYKENDGYWYNSPQGYTFYPISESFVTCTNQLQLEICPYGSFCPTAFQKYHCHRGSYCGMGFTKEQVCSFGALSCPYKGMSEQLIWVLVIMFSGLLTIVMAFYYYHQRKAYEGLDDKLDAISNVQAAKRYQLLQEQKRTNEMLDSLSKAQLREGSQPMSTVLGHRRPSTSMSTSSIETIERSKPASEGFQFTKIEEPLTITFSKLSLVLKKPPHDVLLNNIFGTVRPFNITALMGPSGAGKTTLLNLLRGAVKEADTFGEITVNFIPVPSLAAYRSDMAFVPQDDTVYEELSVEDNITYSAMLFNRRGMIRSEDVVPMVSKAMKMLGIDWIKHSLVGGHERKGISGGQRKRVSIAMEMMKEAALFFLDEPTSGLDSATSISVLWCLKELANLGYNVVATLHQPRQEILDMLDHLILIAPGGRVVFAGSPRRLREHFIRFGYQPSSHCNMADFMMDVLAGFVLPCGSKRHQDVNSATQALCDWWQENKEDTVSQKPPSRTTKARKQSSVVHNRGNEPAAVLFFRTFNVAFARQKKTYYRTFQVIGQTCFLLIVSGVAVGFLLGPVRLSNFNAPSFVTQTITGQLVFGIFTTSSGLKLFGNDYHMRLREIEGGVWLLPMFLGKILASYVEYMFYPFAFLAGYYSVIRSNTVFEYYWGLFFLMHLSLFSLANFVSILIPGKIKDLVMLGLLVVLWLFGGVQPPQPELETAFPVLGPFLNYISPYRWSFQLATNIEMNGHSEIWKPVIDSIYKNYGFSHNYVINGGMLIVYALIINFFAYCALAMRVRDLFCIRLCFARADRKVRKLTGTTAPKKTKSQPTIKSMPSRDGTNLFSQQQELGFVAVETYDSGDVDGGLQIVRGNQIEESRPSAPPSAPHVEYTHSRDIERKHSRDIEHKHSRDIERKPSRESHDVYRSNSHDNYGHSRYELV